MALCLAEARGIVRGTVVTRNEVLSGTLSATNNGLRVGTDHVRLEDVLSVAAEQSVHALRQPGAVRLRNGDVWPGRITRILAGSVSLRSAVLGSVATPLKAVQALEFQPGLEAVPEPALNTLHRTEGEPLPGQLLWLTSAKIAIDSPLGAIAVNRERLSRYVLAPYPGEFAVPKPGRAELQLVDGTVLQGELSSKPDCLVLKHPTLDELEFPLRLVRSVLAAAADVTWLGSAAAEVRSQPLTAPPDASPTVRYNRGGNKGTGTVRCLTILPNTTVSYRVNGPGTFRCSISPVSGHAGTVRLGITSGSKTIVERQVADAKQAPEWISADVDDSVTLEVSFVDGVRFPSGVVLGDAHVVARREAVRSRNEGMKTGNRSTRKVTRTDDE